MTGGWDAVVVIIISRSTRWILGPWSSNVGPIAARSAIDFNVLKGSGALISGVEPNCGGPFRRGWLGFGSMKLLGVGELGGFTFNGNNKLDPVLVLLLFCGWELLLVSFAVLIGGLWMTDWLSCD